MKVVFKSAIIIFLVCLGLFSKAQTFSTTAGGNVPDNALTLFPIQVSGLPNNINMSFGIISVCCDVAHPSVGQIDLIIKAPNGLVVKLSNNRGSNGRNYTNTCFKENGTLPIQSGVAPFMGNYIPDESINAFNTGINPNGIWYFGVLDEIPFATGRLNSASITFGANPPVTPVLQFCTVFNGQGCKCPDGTQDCDLLPDITDAEKTIKSYYYDDIGVVNIGVGTPNIGYGPLEMRGTGECYCDTVKVNDCNAPCPNGSFPKEKVIQRYYHKSGNIITSIDRTAGFMQYHPTHGHTHIDDWTNNSLRLKGPSADALTWPIIGTATKVSFCLVNNYNCSNQLGACILNGNVITYEQTGNPGMGILSGCSREQGIYPGYLDIYLPGYDGQAIPLDSNTACNGVYYVVSQVDPYKKIKEINTNNNVAAVPISLAFQKKGNCCKTGFYADVVQGEAPITVNFIDTTKPSSHKWFWDFGDGTTDTVQFPKHTYTKPGNYSVSLKTIALETACTDSVVKSKYIKVRKSADATNPFNINVYPNPFIKNISVYYNLTTAQNVTITMFDILGRMVYNSPTYNESSGIYEKQLNLNYLQASMYVVKVMVGKEAKYIKVIKTN